MRGGSEGGEVGRWERENVEREREGGGRAGGEEWSEWELRRERGDVEREGERGVG